MLQTPIDYLKGVGPNRADLLRTELGIHTYQDLINLGIVSEGMLPKLNNCFHAIENKVSKVCIGKTEMLFKSNSKFTTIQK